MGVHGGTDETSMMLHLAPHLVDMSVAERRVPEKLADNRYVRFGGRVSFGWLSNDFFPDGYIGDPDRGDTPSAAPSCSTARCTRRSARGARARSRALQTSARDRAGATCASPWTRISRRERLDLRVDGARLWERIEALGEIGAVHGPNGERGCARLALTDADGDGRDLVVSWMADLGLDVTIDAIGNVVATRAGTIPGAGAGDDRLAHRHGAHRWPLRRQPRRARRAGGARDARASTASTPAARSQRRVLHRRGGRPLRARHARQPRLRRRAGRGGGARRARRRRRRPPRRRAGPHRLRRPARRARRPWSRTRSSSCTSSRARCSRTRASRSVSSPACRASRGPS